jgi:diguanylate cyclase (GGDEF)-like protein
MYRSHTELRPRSLSGRGQDLAAENARLQARLAELKDEAARNDSLLRKTQERELELLRAGTLTQLFDRLINGLRTSYQLDLVTLTLHDPQFELRHLIWGDSAAMEEMPEVRFVDSLDALPSHVAKLDKPLLGPFDRAEHGTLCPVAGELGSLALIPLRRNDQLDGVLVFASSDPFRFHADLASDFLAHLGLVAALCLENAANRARLLRSGLTDFLTGFHNRRYLNARLREELARAQRFRQPIAALMIDVDHFKRVNDQYGHLAGDALLREAAKRIDAEMRVSDIGARFGGDEFALILPQGDIADGERVAKRILDAVRGTPVQIEGGHSEFLSLSIGVAVCEPPADTRDFKLMAERLLAEADAALYRAKTGGRNRVAVSQNVVV